MDAINKSRFIDPFFEKAVNQIFIHSDKTAFVMDGAIGVGKSSNFVAHGAYSISQLVTPIKKGSRMVRESRWAAIRESENSALATITQLFGESIFTPEIMALDDSPFKSFGSHPAKVLISHDLPDGTLLEMKIECHGFDNKKAHNRLRTHEFMGAMIFEMQGIPFDIFEVAQERCGRFRTNSLTITKEINGKTYKLSGQTKLAMVLCDINIPERPHDLYEKYYDVIDKSKLPYMFITPPSPLIYKNVNEVGSAVLDKYPVVKFEGEDTVWLPNPNAYNMTRHFEEKDDAGNHIPWTGYNYWFSRLHQSDSKIRRFVLGKPDTVGGEAAIYKKFDIEKTIKERNFIHDKVTYVSFDPGGYAAVVVGQLQTDNTLHFHNEFIFEPADGVSTREIFSKYVFPYLRKKLTNSNVEIIPDPASTWLGKNVSTGQTESILAMIIDEMNTEMKTNPGIKYKISPCQVSNQMTDVRIDSLAFFIDKGKISLSKKCDILCKALGGGYQRKILRSGLISNEIDKNLYSHPAESAQYMAVNVLNYIRKGVKNGNNSSSRKRIYKVKKSR